MSKFRELVEEVKMEQACGEDILDEGFGSIARNALLGAGIALGGMQGADAKTDPEMLRSGAHSVTAKYVDDSHENLKCWKALCPRANGAGVFGESLSQLVIGEPNIGYTQTFIGIGAFDNQFEAEAVMKYIKTKFARTLLDVLKVTQDNDRGVWRLIPLQNFTENSDIDWSKSIHEIDLQLYRKYGLDEKEIEFIETHVKEMV